MTPERRFGYRLALALGIDEVEEWLHRLSAKQLALWMRYADAEPFGQERQDMPGAIVASVIANVNRDPKRSHPFSPQDFLPYSARNTPGDRELRQMRQKFGHLVKHGNS